MTKKINMRCMMQKCARQEIVSEPAHGLVKVESEGTEVLPRAYVSTRACGCTRLATRHSDGVRPSASTPHDRQSEGHKGEPHSERIT